MVREESVSPVFVDANVIIRYVAGDNLLQAEASRAYLQRLADGRALATTSEAVVAEITHVLCSKRLYDQPRDHIRNVVKAILGLRGWRLIDRSTWFRALDIFAEYQRLDFPDALAAAHVEQRGLLGVLSYDRDFDKIPGVRRVEP